MKARWRATVTLNAEKRAQLRERDRLRWDADVQGYLWMTAKKRAKKSGIEFTIKPKDVVVVDVCPIMGTPMRRYREKLDRESFSLDRVDNTKGYVPGNVKVISWIANQTKNNLTLEQIERLYKYSKGEI
jgi:hypothetical protein